LFIDNKVNNKTAIQNELQTSLIIAFLLEITNLLKVQIDKNMDSRINEKQQ
jgi:hypothetical protein